MTTTYLASVHTSTDICGTQRWLRISTMRPDSFCPGALEEVGHMDHEFADSASPITIGYRRWWDSDDHGGQCPCCLDEWDESGHDCGFDSVVFADGSAGRRALSGAMIRLWPAGQWTVADTRDDGMQLNFGSRGGQTVIAR